MNATLTETKEQERTRLLSELRSNQASMKSACRAENWDGVWGEAMKCSWIADQLDKNRERKE